MLIAIPTLAGSTGRTTLSLGVRVAPGFNGLRLYGQAAVLDATANPWGVVTSNAVEHQAKAPWTSNSVGTVYLDGGLGPTGTVRKQFGYVVRFET